MRRLYVHSDTQSQATRTQEPKCGLLRFSSFFFTFWRSCHVHETCHRPLWHFIAWAQPTKSSTAQGSANSYWWWWWGGEFSLWRDNKGEKSVWMEVEFKSQCIVRFGGITLAFMRCQAERLCQRPTNAHERVWQGAQSSSGCLGIYLSQAEEQDSLQGWHQNQLVFCFLFFFVSGGGGGVEKTKRRWTWSLMDSSTPLWDCSRWREWTEYVCCINPESLQPCLFFFFFSDRVSHWCNFL